MNNRRALHSQRYCGVGLGKQPTNEHGGQTSMGMARRERDVRINFVSPKARTQEATRKGSQMSDEQQATGTKSNLRLGGLVHATRNTARRSIGETA